MFILNTATKALLAETQSQGMDHPVLTTTHVIVHSHGLLELKGTNQKFCNFDIYQLCPLHRF